MCCEFMNPALWRRFSPYSSEAASESSRSTLTPGDLLLLDRLAKPIGHRVLRPAKFPS